MPGRRRQGRPLPKVGDAADSMNAAAAEYRMLGREIRQFGIDFLFYKRDGVFAVRLEIADAEIEPDEGEGGISVLNMMMGLLSDVLFKRKG